MPNCLSRCGAAPTARSIAFLLVASLEAAADDTKSRSFWDRPHPAISPAIRGDRRQRLPANVILADDQPRFVETIYVDHDIEIAPQHHDIIQCHQLLRLFVTRHCEPNNLNFATVPCGTGSQPVAKMPAHLSSSFVEPPIRPERRITIRSGGTPLNGRSRVERAPVNSLSPVLEGLQDGLRLLD